MKKIIYLLISFLLIAGCGRNSTNDMSLEKTGFQSESAPVTGQVRQNMQSSQTPAADVKNEEINKKKIIKDGNIQLKVSNLEKSKSRIDTLIAKYKGYYDNVNFNNTDYESTYNLKIRVPSDNFEKLVAGVESEDAEVTFKAIRARDVTEQFIDLETRLENKRNYLKQYNELLKKAKTVKDILDIEEKIRGLEEEIESTEGRLKYLNDQVSYSTLDLTLTKVKAFRFVPKEHGQFIERLKQSLSRGWFGFVSFILFPIRIWPFWIILAIVIPLWKKWRKRRKEKK